MPRLKLKKPPGEALKALARNQLSQTVKRIAEARAGAKVHGARRGLKFARSLLRLVHHAIGEEAFSETDRLLRDAARLLAKARHAEALLETVAKLEPGDAASALRDWAAARQPGTNADPGGVDPTLEAERLVLAARKQAGKWSLAKHDLTPLVAGLRASYGKARRTLRKGLDASSAEVLHQARKSVIHHLHHLEILADIWPPLFRSWTAELDVLRLALGDLNDLDELERTLADDDRQPKPDAAEAIAARRAALIAVIAAKSGLLFSEKPSAFAARMEAMWRHTTE